jgi:hypothetical protein
MYQEMLGGRSIDVARHNGEMVIIYYALKL